MLEKYLASSQEKIIYRFGVGLQYILVSISLWAIFLGGLSYFFRETIEHDLFSKTPLVVLVLVSIFYVAHFLSAVYFISDDKIYKRIGIGWVKVTSAKHSEIDDMKIQQGFLEKILFRAGTMKFNTPGSPGFEIILPRVQNPYQVKKEIYEAWKK